MLALIGSSTPPLPDRDPAVVLDGGLIVVGANRRWRALHLPFENRSDWGAMVFRDPAAGAFFVDRKHEEYDVVAALREGTQDERTRTSAGNAADRLRQASSRFDLLWSGRRVRQRLVDTYVVSHPDLGKLSFSRQTLRQDGLLLRVCMPSPPTLDLLPLLDLLTS